MRSEKDPQREIKGVLGALSKEHRNFVVRYSEEILFAVRLMSKKVWLDLIAQSTQLKSINRAKFLFEHIRIDGEREVKKVTRIFTASIDGWKGTDKRQQEAMRLEREDLRGATVIESFYGRYECLALGTNIHKYSVGNMVKTDVVFDDLIEIVKDMQVDPTEVFMQHYEELVDHMTQPAKPPTLVSILMNKAAMKRLSRIII